MTELNRWTTIGCALLLLSSPVGATTDAETPEQELEMLRLLLVQPEIARAVWELARGGCRWSEEVVWFGGGDELEEGVYSTSGGFTIFYLTQSGEQRQLGISWGGVHDSAGRRIDYVSVPDLEPETFDCR